MEAASIDSSAVSLLPERASQPPLAPAQDKSQHPSSIFHAVSIHLV